MLRILVALLAGLTSSVFAGNAGKMQIFATAFLDVQGLFPNTLQSCSDIAPASVAPLQAAYAQWQAKHGVYQQELQQIIRKNLLLEVGAEQTEQAIAAFKYAASQQIAPIHFPQNYHFKDDYFCTRSLLREFAEGTGDSGGLPLKFADYVREWKQQSIPAK
ncbi:hypothetical protein [Aquitalea magnusonii]|uniref:Uncharacterized protein n=1 Tax=Aquitalea magnusonii TaxID=332411 RepID=A0A318JFP0_9NEIS|nr:hypothetical protein [Aquitalea magnusonii]PXX45667.1 hypothetical protein DFR38_11158 [Aquitalea magnusonii]